MQNEASERLAALERLLAVSPANVLARSDLASVLEQLDLHDEALFHWKTVLEFDPNSLKAREGVIRCRNRTGPPVQSEL